MAGDQRTTPGIHFAAPGVSFADAHAALAHAMAGNEAALTELKETSAGTASDIVNAPRGCLSGLRPVPTGRPSSMASSPVMGSHERLGGSNAQRDLLEFTLLHALLKLGKQGRSDPPLPDAPVRCWPRDGLPASLFSEMAEDLTGEFSGAANPKHGQAGKDLRPTPVSRERDYVLFVPAPASPSPP